MALLVCIDGDCNMISIFTKNRLPFPVCNQNGTLYLAGNGTLSGVLESFTRRASETAIDLVLSSLGIKVLILIKFHVVNDVQYLPYFFSFYPCCIPAFIFMAYPM